MSTETASHKTKEKITDLEDLVPKLNLCKQIPSGAFKNSVLVWWGHPFTDKTMEVVPRAELGVTCHVFLKKGIRILYPAPTLKEIMKAFSEKVEYKFFNGNFLPCHPKFDEEDFADKKPENATLKLWMQINVETKGIEKP